ncbi:MAG: hypothetical protein ABJA80_05735 [bacterium]
MADPIYNGQMSAVTRASWFGSWFGGTPAYKSAPAAVSDAPNVSPSPSADDTTTNPTLLRPIVIVVPRDVIEVPCDSGAAVNES